MAYEDRQNGTHAMTCDTSGCHHECLSPGLQELHEDLSLAGWVKVGKDEFRCPNCGQGSPAAALLNAMTGGTGEVPIEVPMRVSKGDAHYDPDGNVVGHYTEDGDAGDTVQVKVQLPDVPAPPSAVESYDEMLEGTDDDDDQHGRVSAVAPAGGVVGVPSSDHVANAGAPVAAPSSPGGQYGEDAGTAGTAGADGIVHAAKRPDLTTPEAQARLRSAPTAARGPVLDTDALAATAAIFDNLDPADQDWDPDDA